LKKPLRQLAYNKRKHKQKLQGFLKKFDKIYIPEMLYFTEKASETTWRKVDCTECGNCCVQMTPTYTDEDIQRIAKHFKISKEDFIKKWLKKSSGDYVNKKLPCQFLDSNKLCSIYEIRPHDCAAFPHLLRQPFDDNNKMYAQNINYCPATMEFIKDLEKNITAKYQL